MVNYLGKLAGRKGMGMELALLVLFVVMACSILLVSSAMVGKSNLNDRKDQLLQRAQVDMFAEDVLAVVAKGDTYVDENENYDLNWSDDNTVLTISQDGETLLTVTVVDNKVVSWVYG